MSGGGGGSTTIGYRYFMGMHLAICKGPDNTLLEIFVGERSAWTGNITTNSSIFIDEPNLFGGEKKEGGVQGDVDVELGGPTQGKNSYLQTQLGSNIPAFRGVLCLVLKQIYLTAMSRYPKPWAILVKRPAATGWYDAARFIGNSANGAHIIYECLTDADYGLGLSPGFINNSSFQAVADTLKAEGFGLSLLFSKQVPIEKFIQTILTHISAILYTDKNTGNFVLKLIREPTVGELTAALQLDETNITALNSFERPSFAEMINEIIVSFRPQGAFKDRTITVQDLASVQAQNGIISQTLRFPGIDNETIASRVAQRELKQYSTPLAKVSITVNREAWGVSPGDVVKLDWPDYGLVGMIVRVLSIDYGTLTQGTITLEGTEDIYALPFTTYLANQPPLWVDPVTNPQTVAITGLYEVPFFEINENFNPGIVATVDELTCFLQALPLTPPSASPNHEMQLSPDTVLANYFADATGGYVPSVLIDAQLNLAKTAGIEIIAINSFSGVVSAVNTGTYAYIDDEIILIETINLSVPEIGIRRGLLDSNPAVHLAGARIYFVEQFQTISIASFLTDPVTQLGEDVFVRYLVRTDIGLLDIANATEFNYPNFFGRQALPYPPKAVFIENVFYPTARNQGNNNTNSTVINWSSVDRQLQTKPFRNWYFNSDVPEDTTVLHVITHYGEGGAAVNKLRETTLPYTGLSNYSLTYITADEAEDSGFIFTGSEFLQGGVSVTITNYPIYEVIFVDSANSRTTRPVQPLVNGEKFYSEFNADAENYSIGISSQNIPYSETATANIAYLQVFDDTLIGMISGTAGTGVMSGNWCAIAVDTRAMKFWVSDTAGTWRDGDPATGVGGYDYSTLVHDFVYIAVVTDSNSGSGFTIEMNWGNKPYVFTPPVGFTRNVIWDITDPLTREVNSGSNLTIDPDGLVGTSISSFIEHNMQAGSLETGGRWYFEGYGVIDGSTGINFMHIGIAENITSNSLLMGANGRGCIWSDNGDLRIDGVFPIDIEGYSVSDRVGVGYDLNKQEITFYKNGVIALDAGGGAGGGGPYSFSMVDARPAIGLNGVGSQARFSFNVQAPNGFRSLNVHSHEDDKIRINGTMTAEIFVTHDRTFDNGGGSALHTLKSRQTWTHTWDRNGLGLQFGRYFGGLQVA